MVFIHRIKKKAHTDTSVEEGEGENKLKKIKHCIQERK
jgi:hypothetical protein